MATSAQRKRTKARQQSSHKYHIKVKYGITPEEYAAMLLAQDGRCFICGRKSSKMLAVDHDHECCPGPVSCGKCIRKLLCADCNWIWLGRILQETKQGKAHAIEVCRRMITYLGGDSGT